MFNFIKNLFKREEPKPREIRVRTVEVRKIEPKYVQPEVVNHCKLTTKFRNTKTGEVHVVEYGDSETFDKLMGDRNMQLVFN